MNNKNQTAAILIIGNEILSGKIKDANSHYLAKELRFLGIEVGEMVTISDVPKIISAKIKDLHLRFDWVFTSGGIGPTHDDKTIVSLASAFGSNIVVSEKLLAVINKYYKNPTPAHLKMAEIPEGAKLIQHPSLYSPQILFKNIFVFPGVPSLLKQHFSAIKERFKKTSIYLMEYYLKLDEGNIAETLEVIETKFEGVLVGSYPKFFREDYTLLITLESRDKSILSDASDYLANNIPPKSIINKKLEQ